MGKHRYVVVLMATLLFAACGSDSVSTPLQPVDNGPGFVNADELPVSYSVSAEAVTRAGDDEALEGDILVCSWYRTGGSGETMWLGTQVASAYAGERVSKSNDGLWRAESTELWPKGWALDVDFYATYPTTAPGIQQFTDNTNPTEPYTYKGVKLTAGAGNDNVTDLRYAYTSTDKAEARSNNGTVSLNFKHALSQLSFYGITDNEDWHVEVQGISLHNILSTGTFDLMKGEWNAATLTGNTTYTLTMNSIDPISFGYGDEAKALTQTNSPRLVPGQALTAWDTSSTIAANDAAAGPKGSYLAVKCHIWQGSGNDVDELLPLNADGTYKTAYIPFAAGTADSSWAAGEHYKYTLRFGGGFNDDGEPNLNQPVTISTEIVPWTVVDRGSVSADDN